MIRTILVRHGWMLFCGTLLLFGCRKDEDGTAPSVTILSPSIGVTLNVPDTLVVRVSVSNDRTVESVVISLTDGNGAAAFPSAVVSIGASSATIERAIPVVNETLPSGSYTLTVRATDGTNDGRAFREVLVNEAPLRPLGVFVVTQPSASSTQIQLIDTTGVVGPFLSLGQDFGHAAISSHDQRLFIAGSVSGPLLGLSLPSGDIAWQLPNPNILSSSYFTSADVLSDDRLYSSDNTGGIKAYNAASGTQVFLASALSGFRAHQTCATGSKVVCFETETVGTGKELVIYAASSGAMLDARVLDVDAVALFPLDDDHVLVLGNRNGDGIIQEWTLSTGSSWEPLSFPGDPISAAVPVADNVFVVATGNSIVRYVHPASTSTTLTSLSNVQVMAYDAARGLVLMGSGNSVMAMDPNNGTTSGNTLFTTPVLGVLPWSDR